MKQENKKAIKQKSNGYTLIELMVAMGIFAVVVGITSTMFITSLRGQEKSFTAQNVADSVRYAMEIMTKEIRMGDNFLTTGCPSTPCLQFVSHMPNRDNKTIKFYWDGASKIMFDDDVSDAVPAEPITASNIAVSDLTLDVNSTGGHPRVVIVIETESVGTREDVKTTMNLQTVISPRRL